MSGDTLLIVNAGREVSEKRLKKIPAPAQADVINFLERKSTPLNHCVSDYIHLCQPKSRSLSVVQVQYSYSNSKCELCYCCIS